MSPFSLDSLWDTVPNRAAGLFVSDDFSMDAVHIEWSGKIEYICSFGVANNTS